MKFKEVKFLLLDSDVKKNRAGVMAIQFEKQTDRDEFIEKEDVITLGKKQFSVAATQDEDIAVISLLIEETKDSFTIPQKLRDDAIAYLKKKKYQYSGYDNILLEVIAKPAEAPALDEIPPENLSALSMKLWELKRFYRRSLRQLSRLYNIAEVAYDAIILWVRAFKNETQRFYTEHLKNTVQDTMGLFKAPGQHPGALALAAATLAVGMMSGFSILGYSLLGSAIVFTTSKLRNYVYERTLENMAKVEVSEVNQEEEVSTVEEMAFEDGLRASKSWTAYFNSCLTTRDWRHPLAFGAGLTQGQNPSEEQDPESKPKHRM